MFSKQRSAINGFAFNIFERIKSASAFKFSIKNKYLDPSFFGDNIKLINITLKI